MDNLLRLSQLFSDRMFCVPDYQRSYAWEQRQCRDLLEDLELLAQGKEHFMGTLILHAHSNSQTPDIIDETGRSYKRYDVVDGQQRLTTLVLLLNAIQREMARLEALDKLADGLKSRFLVVTDLNGQLQPKLTLNHDTHDYFERAVLTANGGAPAPRIRAHQLISEADATFGDYLARKQAELDGDYPDWLKHEFLKITQQLSFLIYNVSQEADAGIIFETMNNRGKPLTELEKVKNYLLYLASKLELPAEHGLAKRINDTWSHIFHHLMAAGLSSGDNEDRLLRAYWIMAYNSDARRWKGSTTVKARFNLRDYQGRHRDLLADLVAYLEGLDTAVGAYCDVLRPQRDGSFGAFHLKGKLQSDIRDASARLTRLGSLATFLPLLMAIRGRYGDQAEAYLQAVELCEAFAFRVYRVRNRRANAGESWLYGMGFRLYNGRESLDATLRNLQRAIHQYCPDDQFERYLRERTNWYAWSGLKYLLYEYESHLAQRSGEAVRMPWEYLDKASKRDSIEHIMPQTIPADGYWAERFDPEQHKRYLHDIGNLTLTLNNSSYGNKPFPEKRGDASLERCYASSKLFVEQRLAQVGDWTADAIEARRDQIIAWMLERWQVDSPARESEGPQTEDARPEPEDFDRILLRKSVPNGQIDLFRSLYRHPEGLTHAQLVKMMGRRDRNDLSGVLGAFGKRINGTTGYGKTYKPGGEMALKWTRLPSGEWRISLRPEMRAALERVDPPWLKK